MNKSNTVVAFPQWKTNATAAERFDELAGVARERPERFKKLVVIYVEEGPTGNLLVRKLTDNLSTYEVIGLLHVVAHAIDEETKV